MPPLTEAVSAEAPDLDRLPPESIVRLMARAERASAAALERAAPEVGRIAEMGARALGSATGRVVIVGAGTSGRLGALEAAECPPTFGSDPSRVVAIMAGGRAALERAVEGAEDRADDGAQAIAYESVRADDLVIGVSASGRAPFVRGALAAARERGARTALLTCDPASALLAGAQVDEVALLEVGPEVLAGSTRLKSGTVTKMALNAITTAAFASLGKVYGNLMVDVQVTNRKLGARARRIVRDLCGCSEEEARSALDAAHGRAKVAVVMRRLGLSVEEAERALAAAGGSLRRVAG